MYNVKYGIKPHHLSLCGAEIFYANTADLDIDAAKKAVSQYRLAKAERLRRTQDMRCSLSVELLLIAALEGENIKTSLEFTENEFGKPILKYAPNVHFSLSHSGDLAMCAIAKIPVGVDCEKCDRVSREVMERCFTETERRTMDENALCFAQIWTRKEAVAKCEGTGISIGLKKIDTLSKSVSIQGKRYDIFDIPLNINGYVGAVSLQSASLDIQ